MVKLGHLSIDGTKIKASASNFSVLSKEELEEIKEAIDMELRKGIEIDDMEDEIYGDTDPDKLPKPFKDIKERIRKDKAARNCRSRGCGPKCQGCRPIEATNRTD